MIGAHDRLCLAHACCLEGPVCGYDVVGDEYAEGVSVFGGRGVEVVSTIGQDKNDWGLLIGHMIILNPNPARYCVCLGVVKLLYLLVRLIELYEIKRGTTIARAFLIPDVELGCIAIAREGMASHDERGQEQKLASC